MDITEIEAFNILARTIKNDYKARKREQDKNIKLMYKILKRNDYTRFGAINTIHQTIVRELDSMIEVRKTHIEDVTKKLGDDQ